MQNKILRKSNFELLRIIAMFLIVAGHFAAQTQAVSNTTGANCLIALYFGSASRIAVNLFLMIGAWFMVDSDFKSKNVISLYSETWFYSVTFTIFAIGMEPSLLSGKTLIKGVLPYTTISFWFVTIYIDLLLIAPFLKKAFLLSRLNLKNLVVVLFYIVVVMSTVHGFMDTVFCALIYFAFCYLFIGYYKKYLVNKMGGASLLLICAIAIYSLMVATQYVCIQNEGKLFALINKAVSQYLSDYKSLPNFIIALLTFTAFAKMKIDSNKVINRVAKSAFAVYVMHQVPAFYNVMWFKIFKADLWYGSSKYILFYISTCIVIYIVAVIVDEIRRITLDKWWMGSKTVKFIQNKIDGFYKEI